MNPVIEQLQNEIAQSLSGLTVSQTQLRPATSVDKWTIQQIVQHLCLSYSSTEETIGNRLSKGRPTQAVPTLQQRLAQLFITKFGYFPSGREAPSIVVPPKASESPEHQVAGEHLSRESAQCLARMDKVLEDAHLHFGEGRATHPVLGPLTIPQWRRFHLVHGRHHLKQIQAIRRQHGV